MTTPDDGPLGGGSTDSRQDPTATNALPATVQAELAGLIEAGQELRAGHQADLTRRAYLSDFSHFADWARYRHLEPPPPTRPRCGCT